MANQLIVSTRKGLFSFQKNSTNQWDLNTAEFLGDSVTLALFDSRTGYYYAALNHGHFGVKLHRTKRLGSEWEELDPPAYPQFPEDREPDRCPMRGIEIPWTLQQIWSIVPGGSDQPGRLWCGTLPGGLFKSDDNGETWGLVESLWNRPERAKWMGGGYDYPGIHSICVHPEDSNRLAIAISCGGVWQTRDDGASWEQIGNGLRAEYAPTEEAAYDPVAQDVHLMAQCRIDPNHLWVQHHNGIFRSIDGGHTFSEIKEAGPSVFGFAVAAHPLNPNTAWFAPAIKDEHRIPKNGELVITRTRNGGESFDILREGLPQKHAYDLVYRHGLAVDSQGGQLAFGSTTGSLWASEDEGDHWFTLSNHLPPIYSVSFVEG